MINQRVSGLYQLDNFLNNNLPVYPWAPGSNINIDNQGINNDYIDTHSDLLNLTRPLTNNIHLQYSPFNNKLPQQKLW